MRRSDYLTLLLAMALTPATLTAAVGEDAYVTNLCYDAAQHSVLYELHNAHVDLSCFVQQLRLRTGQVVSLGECPEQAYEPQSAATLHSITTARAGCQRLLEPLNLANVRLEHDATPRPLHRNPFIRPDGMVRPLVAGYLACAYHISLRSGDRLLGQVPINPCCDNDPNLVRIKFYPLPSTRHMAAVLSYRGQCFEGGYQLQQVALVALPDRLPIQQSADAPRHPYMRLTLPRQEVDLLDLYQQAGLAAWKRDQFIDAIDYLREAEHLDRSAPHTTTRYPTLLDDLGQQAHRSGDWELAIELFALAWDASQQAGRVSLPDALLHRARSECRGGKPDVALLTLQLLLTSDQLRAQFEDRLTSDTELAAVRSLPEFKTLIPPIQQ